MLLRKLLFLTIALIILSPLVYFGTGIGQQAHTLSSEPVTLADGTVFFTDFGTFHALDIDTGLERWQFTPENGTGAIYFAPLVIDDIVLTTSGNTAYALERYSGEILWWRRLPSHNLIPAGAKGEHVYLKGTNRLYALDRVTGADLWSFAVTNIVTLPAITGESIYLVTRTGGQAQLCALNQADGQTIWQVVNTRLSNAAPVVAGGQVYVRTVDGRVLAYGQELPDDDLLSTFLGWIF